MHTKGNDKETEKATLGWEKILAKEAIENNLQNTQTAHQTNKQFTQSKNKQEV